MDTSDIIAIVATSVATAALLWGVFTHIASRRRARLIYEVSQLSNFDVPNPDTFFHGISLTPVSIEIESTGNKSALNVELCVETKSDIERFTSVPAGFGKLENNRTITACETELNPTQKIRLLLNCKGHAWENQIEKIELTHSEGKALDNKTTISFISFDLFIVELEYNFSTGKLHIKRIGPFTLSNH